MIVANDMLTSAATSPAWRRLARAGRDRDRLRHRRALLEQEREGDVRLAIAAVGDQEERVEEALRAFREIPACTRLIHRRAEMRAVAARIPRHQPLGHDRQRRVRFDHRRHARRFQPRELVEVNRVARPRRQEPHLLELGRAFAQIANLDRDGRVVRIEQRDVRGEERAGRPLREDRARRDEGVHQQQVSTRGRIPDPVDLERGPNASPNGNTTPWPRAR